MRVHTQKQRTRDLMLFPIQANGLADSKDVPLVKCNIEGRTAMPRGTEQYPLREDGGIRDFRIIGRNEFGDIYQRSWISRLSCKRAEFYGDLRRYGVAPL